MLNGYAGKILWADLSSGKLTDESLTEKLCQDYIGGYGIGARIIFDRQKPGADPLGPDNILGFVTGPLTGTPAITGNRYQVMAKSPLTGCWGDANSGGDFGPSLKFAGYDAVFFIGIAEKPVYLFINNGKAELRNADYLWGKDTFETEQTLKEELGKDISSCYIGPAGEQLSLIASIMNNLVRAAGRSGMGAVMGSKKLKAIVVSGNNKFPIADLEKANQLRKEYVSQLSDNMVATLLRDYGTPIFIDYNTPIGRTPVKNWSGIGTKDFANPASIGGEKVVALQEKRAGCWRCPILCGGDMKAGTEYKYRAGAAKPEYETLASFGTMCLNDNLESIVKLNDICNLYGMDTMSAGAIVAAAIEWYERGIISSQDTDGIELKWGDHSAIVALTEKIGKREGFGAILADGVKGAAEKIGKGAEEYAMHIGGQEAPYHDPKFAPSYLLAYHMDASPGRHTQGGAYHCEMGTPIGGIDIPALETHEYHGKGEAHKTLSDQMHVVNASGTCLMVNLSLGFTPVLDFLNAVMGQSYTVNDLLKVGERIANIRHIFNLREGINPLDRKIPGRLLGRPPQAEGPLKDISVDEESLVQDYLAAMDWDPVTTRPSNQKLKELGLEDVISQLPANR